MANGSDDPRTKSELLDYISDLEEENSDLQDALDSIADIVAGPPTAEDEDEDQDDDDSDDGDYQD